MSQRSGKDPQAGATEKRGSIRDLSLFDITMVGVGAMIGAGIFVLTGIAAGTAGPALILAFALNGVVTVFTAMVYAELGSAIPEAGGGWIGVGLFLVTRIAFTSLSVHPVDKQCEESESIKRTQTNGYGFRPHD